ncbi:SDR family oxidoreductase [Corynebacterium breve]|uniref:SDR family oxidoreductase n=1 Tax=Corynebacterium breve TaxID=3049799 RepID=A0ABY8VDS1_9CORY|nr:SDR family oxidoreductase [Corynebacterium breve]WIM67816.1 SDR family oxidoreductase [Corynebacterium breve]
MRKIFISGGAQGIGRATAEKFLSEGWLVGIGDVQPAPWAEGIENLIVTHLDVTDPESWDKALAEFTAHTGGELDVLDNNAGIIIDGPLADEDPARIQKIIDVNVTGLTLGARAAHKYLKATPGSHLVNISSASAVFGQPGIAAYSASKFYVNGLTEALSLEWEKDGIRVVDVMPLWAKTPVADVSAASVRKLGVNLTTEQVADAVWESVNPKNRWQRGRLHYGVGIVDKLFYVAGQWAPDRVARLVTKIVAG